MAAVGTICADPAMGWSPGMTQVFGVFVWSGSILFQGFMLIYSIVSVGGYYYGVAQFQTVETIIYAIVYWLYWALEIVLQGSIYWLIPLGETWKTGCEQGSPQWSLIWEALNVIGFPDIFMTVSFPFAVVHIFISWLRSGRTYFNWKYAVVTLFIFIMYCTSNMALNRSSWAQLAANALLCLFILGLQLAGATLFFFQSRRIFDDTLNTWARSSKENWRQWYIQKYMPELQRAIQIDTTLSISPAIGVINDCDKSA